MRLLPTLAWELSDDPSAALDPRLLPLIRAVAETGSLAAAVADRGLSYRAAWGLLRTYRRKLGDPLVVLELGVESIWATLRRLGDMQLAAFDLLVQAPRTERLQAYLPELFTRYREVIQEQIDRLERDGRVRLTVKREVLVPLVLNTVLGFGLYYVVTRDDESCVQALSAFRQLAATLIEPVGDDWPS